MDTSNVWAVDSTLTYLCSFFPYYIFHIKSINTKMKLLMCNKFYVTIELYEYHKVTFFEGINFGYFSE